MVLVVVFLLHSVKLYTFHNDQPLLYYLTVIVIIIVMNTVIVIMATVSSTSCHVTAVVHDTG